MGLIIAVIIGSLLLVFIQAILNTLSVFSLLLVVAVFAYSRMRLVAFLGLILPATLLNDIYFSYPIGFTFLLLIIACLLFKLVCRFLPMSNIPVEIITLIFLFIGFHLLFFMAAGVLEQGQIGLSWRELFSAVKFSLIEVAIYFALKTVVSKISESSHSTIKL